MPGGFVNRIRRENPRPEANSGRAYPLGREWFARGSGEIPVFYPRRQGRSAPSSIRTPDERSFIPKSPEFATRRPRSPPAWSWAGRSTDALRGGVARQEDHTPERVAAET